jgi:DNA-binding NarL/FixJ family response regulator
MEEALARMDDVSPRVILVDIGLSGMSGIEGIPLLRARWPAASVLVLAVY